MASTLILDISDRYLFAMIEDRGQFIPSYHKVESRIYRYFSGSLYLDSNFYDERINNEFSQKITQILAQNRDNPFFKGQYIGWLRPWEINSDVKAEAVIHPLRILLWDDSEKIRDGSVDISDIATAMLMFVFQPLVSWIHKHQSLSSRINIFAIVPDYLTRSSLAILRKVLRAFMPKAMVRGVGHTAALSMNMIRWGLPGDFYAFHSDEDALHQARAKVTWKGESHCHLDMVGCTSAWNLGWKEVFKTHLHPSICRPQLEENEWICRECGYPVEGVEIGQECPACGSKQEYSQVNSRSLEKAVFELIAGLPTDRNTGKILPRLDPFTISDSMENFLSESIHEYMQQTILSQKIGSFQVITSGILPMLRSFDSVIENTISTTISANVARIPGIERSAYGVARMLKWLNGGKDRTVTICQHNGIRVSTGFDQESIEVVSPESLRLSVGETRIVEQVLALEIKRKTEDAGIVVLWGNHPMTSGNAFVELLKTDMNDIPFNDIHRIRFRFVWKGVYEGIRGQVSLWIGDHRLIPDAELKLPPSRLVW